MGREIVDVITRIKRRVVVRQGPLPTPCWIYRGVAERYGLVSIRRGQQAYAHRLMWEHANKQDLADKFCCHKCDVPGCCNPLHLFPGTCRENMQDASRKNRLTGRNHFSGDTHPRRKMSAKLVHRLRQQFLREKPYPKTDWYKAMAAKHKVHFNTLKKAIHGYTWQSV